MKKSDKIISTILILAILIGGGYFAAKHFGLIGGSAATIEEPQDIETVEIWNVNDGYYVGDGSETVVLKDMASAMENSSASYFIGEHECSETYFGYTSMSQTDKETFSNSIINVPYNKLMSSVSELITDGLNQNFSAQTSSHKEELLNETFTYISNAETLIDNNVELKCETLKIDKIFACDADYNPDIRAQFVCIGTAEVTTVSADGDISNTPFGNKGETVTIKFTVDGGIYNIQGYFANFWDYSADRYTFFERID